MCAVKSQLRGGHKGNISGQVIDSNWCFRLFCIFSTFFRRLFSPRSTTLKMQLGLGHTVLEDFGVGRREDHRGGSEPS